jgi:hypothetical protein
MCSGCGEVRFTDNIWGYLWSKFAYGNMLFATALVDADQADVIDRDRPLMIARVGEMCEVADRERGSRTVPWVRTRPLPGKRLVAD